MSVHGQDDERRREQHPCQGELIRRREDAHLDALERRSMRLMASIASAPLTGRDNWNNPPSARGMIPAATDSDASAKCRLLTPTSPIFWARLCQSFSN